MLILTLCSFTAGAGVAAIVAVWLWPAPSVSVTDTMDAQGTAAHTWQFVGPIDIAPRRRSSCSAPSQRPPQRDSRGRFCSRRRGVDRERQ